MTTKRESIAEKIRALRAKAVNIASTESEAAEAAAMIAKLLAKHDMTEDDIREYRQEGTEAVQASTEGRLHMTLRYCWCGVTALTETDAYVDRNGAMTFIGMEHDVEMALYLAEIIVSASVRAVAAGFPKATKLQRESFFMGFGSALEKRLHELAHDRKQAKTETGTAIVVVKGGLIETFKKEAGLALRTTRSRGRQADAGYVAAGKAVGGSMNLNRPLGSG